MNSKQDVNGKESAKRKWASRFSWVVLISFLGEIIFNTMIVIFGIEYNHNEKIYDSINDKWWWLLIMASALLGLTIVEHISKFLSQYKDREP